MEIFFSDNIEGDLLWLDQEESAHCVRVLRHREGDEIFVIDGRGTLCTCVLTDASAKSACARITGREKDWGGHPYKLTLAVCPTKNNDRYEWFAEKATEVGVDIIVPVIGERSERKVFKTERLRKILLSAAKQSLKGAIPQVMEPQSVMSFIKDSDQEALKMIAYCFEEDGAPRVSIMDALRGAPDKRDIVVMIGPEGDFSREEAQAAVAAGFIPVHLGPSRLRTETAAVTAAEAVYLNTI